MEKLVFRLYKKNELLTAVKQNSEPMTCINCGTTHKENYCPNCGQKADVPKITFSTITNELFATLTNMDKGFFFNVKNLFLDPRKVVNDYLRGKRKNILNPVSFLILSITIYLIGDSLIDVSSVANENNSEVYSAGREAGRFVKTNFKYFWILSILWLSVATKLVFQTYNFAEHLAISAFVLGQSTLIGIIGFALFKLPLLFNPVIYILMLWMMYKIFDTQQSKLSVLSKSIGATILFFIQLFVLVVLIGIIKS